MAKQRQLKLWEVWGDTVVAILSLNQPATALLPGSNSTKTKKPKKKKHHAARYLVRDSKAKTASSTRNRQVLLTDVWKAQCDLDHDSEEVAVDAVDWPASVEPISEVLNAENVVFEEDSPCGPCGCDERCRFTRCRNARQGFFCTPLCCDHGGACDLSPGNKADLKLVRSQRFHGYGVVATKTIDSGIVIGEYVGRLKTLKSEHELRDHTFALELKTKPFGMSGKKAFIDAANEGNITRFINHACDASSRFQELRNGGRVAVVVVSCRVIQAYEEVTVDYGSKANFPCLCGARQCRRPA